MKCTKCGNEVKVKDAKFCPFCGGTIEKEEELAGYTRGQFFSYAGDDEFREAWGKVSAMSADEALAWLREHPIVHYVYRFFGEWSDHVYNRNYARIIRDYNISSVASDGKVTSKKYKLNIQNLSEIGKQVFLSKEECEAAIREEMDKYATNRK